MLLRKPDVESQKQKTLGSTLISDLVRKKNERVEKLEQNPQTNFWGNPQIDVHAKNELLKLMFKNFCNRNNTF